MIAKETSGQIRLVTTRHSVRRRTANSGYFLGGYLEMIKREYWNRTAIVVERARIRLQCRSNLLASREAANPFPRPRLRGIFSNESRKLFYVDLKTTLHKIG